MRASIDVCGCFPTGRHYPGIADRLANANVRVAGMAAGFEPSTEWARARLVVIDFETTGLDPERDRIIEIGVACFENGVHSGSQNWLVQPGIAVPKESTDVHGITDAMLEGQPSFGEAFADVARYLEGAIPVAYNHLFDSRFLWAECGRAEVSTGSGAPPACQTDGVWIDPLVWAREVQKDEKGHKLGDVCARLGISLETAHRASFDAEATGKVLLALAPKLPVRYAELLRVQQRYAATQDLEVTWRRR